MNLISSFKYAIEGVITSFKSERNMKIHIFMMIMVIILGFIYQLKIWEWLVCIILFVSVISAELFNTAIEVTVDLAMPNINPQAKLAKDMAAGAVLVLAIGALIAGMLIFLPKIF